ncbi:MAG TPA: ATP-binding cassette domain-containing protein [Planctomycetota bacterium]|nr:ATP-binding cassette domain-containing protein [Planctomycetota bacterium]
MTTAGVVERAVSTRDLRVNYGSREALRGVGFDAPVGSLFGLLGPNGGGKTTLFRVLATLLPPNGGTAQVFGADVVFDPASVRRSLGVVFQAPSLDKILTVRENLRLHGPFYGLRGAELDARIAENADRLQLADRLDARVATLSGGLKRRVEIAKGLLHRPRLLLLDEPTVGLDPGARRDVWAFLAELRATHGVTCLVTTHLMEEAERCDRLVILHQGRVVAEGAPDALRAEIGGDVVQVETRDPEGFAARVRERFGGDAEVVDGKVRLERAEGHRFVPALVDAFPKEVAAVSVGKPTLEDVFLRRTGHRFFDADRAAAEAAEAAASKRRRR